MTMVCGLSVDLVDFEPGSPPCALLRGGRDPNMEGGSMGNNFRKISIYLALLLSLAGCATSQPLDRLLKSGVGAPGVKGCAEHLLAVHGTGKQSVQSSLQNEICAFRTLAERALA